MTTKLQDDWMTSGTGHPRRWAILAVLVVSLLIVVLDNTVLNIALPTIQRDLDASPSQLVWAVDSYILAFAALLFTWGVLGDKYGRKRILIIGLVLFGAASFACAFSDNSGTLIAMRALMGVGGAAVLPTTLAIITVVFPPYERGKAIGAWAGAVGAAVALGPVLGGVLLEHPNWSSWLTGNGWGSVFLINVPIVIIGVIGIARIVPETRNPNPRRLDLMGLVISVIGLTLLIYGIIEASASKSWLSPSVLVPGILGICIIALFLWLESRSDHPSFDVSLFKNRGYAVSLSAVSLAFFSLSGFTFVLPFYLQILRGFSTLQAGLCFLPFAIGQLLAAPRSATMVLRFGYRRVMTFGLAMVTVSLVVLTTLSLQTPVWLILIMFFLFGLGMGNVIAPASTVMQNVLPLERAGAGSAVQNTVRQVFGALGVAIIGTLLATQYAAGITKGLTALPESVPVDPALASAATESIVAANAALTTAEQAGMPAALLEQLRQGAYDAFLSASHVTMWVSVGVVVLAAVLVAFLLPVINPPRQRDGRPEVPADPADALVQREVDAYPEEVREQMEGDTNRDRP